MAVYLEYVTEIYENGHNAVFTSCGHAWTKQHSETEGLKISLFSPKILSFHNEI
jgi:hypothetical protein